MSGTIGILIPVGALPGWGHSRARILGPSGTVGLVVLLVLTLTGRP